MRYWYPLAATALIVCGVAVRLALIIVGWPHTNSEEGTMGLEAMHILLRGAHPIYFYGQNYMGVGEAYIASLAFRFFGISIVSLRLSMIVFYAIFMVGVFWLATLLYSRRVALVSLTTLVVGTPFVVRIQLLADGGKAETMAFGAMMFALASWLALSESTEQATRLTPARPLAPALPEYNYRDSADPRLELYPPLPQESAPDLVAYRPARPRARRATERLIQSARNPWTVARLILALAASILGFLHAPLQMGEASQPLQVAQAQVGLLPGASITSLVKPETQLKRPDLYDNYAQFQQWGGAACSAAALSEVLTAYGVRDATIGREIDELGNYISPNWGLLSHHAFAVIAARHGLRADESTSWTYNQIVYVSQQLGIPVIVNVRITYGYYSFFSGGHFLVVVGGDSQGLAIVDSSEYYIHYLPKDVFYQMFTGYSAAIAPADDHYNLPTN